MKNVHLENYRISFEAMRAYHRSEIDHKAQTIDILKSIITASIVMHSAVIGYIFIEDTYFHPNISIIATIILFLTVSVSTWMIIIITIQKIKTDNGRYEKYRNECLIARKYLGLTQQYDKEYNDISLYWGKKLNQSKSPRKEQGYIKTNLLLVFFGFLISIMSLIVTIFTLIFLFERI